MKDSNNDFPNEIILGEGYPCLFEGAREGGLQCSFFDSELERLKFPKKFFKGNVPKYELVLRQVNFKKKAK